MTNLRKISLAILAISCTACAGGPPSTDTASFHPSATDSSSERDLPVVRAPRSSLRDFAGRPPLPRDPDARLSPEGSTVLALGDRVLSP
jgi:hypothetical protein